MLAVVKFFLVMLAVAMLAMIMFTVGVFQKTIGVQQQKRRCK